jgi:hypothetical protein
MRRGGSFKSRLAALAFAYAIALQALLGAWAGIASAHSIEADASRSLCRTLATGEAQPTDDAAPVHCAVMCLSGVCAGGDPPASVSVAIDYAPLRIASPFSDDRQTIRANAPFSARSARGPPTIG